MAMDETTRRRLKQSVFNEANGITPIGVTKRIKDIIDGVYDQEGGKKELKAAQDMASYERMTEKQLLKELKRLEKEMHDSAKNLEFEKAAKLRDQLKKLKERFYGAVMPDALDSTGQ
jgi:excinuclease ABC subunit B